MVTMDNYEEMMMLYADGELSHEQEQALLAFVAAHPELKKDLELYSNTRITADVAEVYPDKKVLLKPIPVKHVIALPNWQRYAIASGIALLLFGSIYRYTLQQTNQPEITDNHEKKSKPAFKQTIIPVVDTTHSQSTASATNIKPGLPTRVVPVNKSVATSKKVVHKLIIHPSVVQPTVQSHDSITLYGIVLATPNTLPNKNEPPAIQPLKEIPIPTMVASAPKAKSSLWDKLPIDELKKKKLGNMASEVADVYNGMSTPKPDAEDKNITVRVTKRKILISF